MNINITEDNKLIVEMNNELMEAVDSFQSWDGINVNKVVTSPVQFFMTC